MTLAEYLEACRTDPMLYATATERLLAAIGEAEMVDTSKDARLGRIHPGNSLLTHEVVGKLSLGINPDEQPRWG